MAINYLICAAGEGRRFQALFPGTPKPLIRLHGRTMLEWSLASLMPLPEDRLVIITLAAHRVREKLEETIRRQWPFTPLHWLELERPTRGQLETAWLARGLCDPSGAVAIYNCDNYFQSPTLAARLADPGVAGVIPCFRGEGRAWSYCAVSGEGTVTAVREKEPISPWATIGFYHFRDGAAFFRRAGEVIAGLETGDGECYVAPLYQAYIDAGERVVMDPIPLAKPMGTPEQLRAFWGVDPAGLAADNLNRTLVVDIDDTLTIEEPGTPYPEKRPHLAMIQRLREYRERGYTIILLTARRMATCRNDEARVVKRTGAVTLEWLERHGVPFDGLRFGKPYAQNGFYIDDRTVRPSEFLSLEEGEIYALLNREKAGRDPA